MGQHDLERLSDEALVLAVQSDPASEEGRRASSVLLLRWRERIFSWCWRMVRDRELALDLTQECLIRIHRGLPAFESRASLSSWIFTIARNRCHSAMRARPLRRDHEVEPDDLDGTLAGPEESADHRMRLQKVLSAMNEALAPLERRALWLRAGEGMHVEEITRLLRLDGASGARSLLQTARKKLHAVLGREYEEVE